ncbi:hypothetical protein, partial [Klebsiella pneumoniae]|uniref:hypothetical protein n=1 Tax=Klebsiella pneumoniae TaxID=573 RepID=UPI002731D6BD
VAHVGDFGIAKFLGQSQDPRQSSTTGVRGTVGYAAPGKNLKPPFCLPLFTFFFPAIVVYE